MSTPDRDPSDEERRESEIVSKHLDPAYTANFDGTVPDEPPKSSNTTQTSRTSIEPESSLMLPGGDIHRNLYKMGARSNPMKRAQTFSHPEAPRDTDGAADPREPQGFRRQFLQQKQRSMSYTQRTKNFVSFLDIYGGLAGQDLFDDDSAIDDDEEDVEEQGEESEQIGERRPLLGRRTTSKATKAGTASVTRTFVLLMKSFIGTGVLFLPKAFKNGGILFSSITLVTVSLISSWAFHLLLQCKARYGGGYGEVAGAIGGKRMRSITLFSISLSQLGFVCAGVIFAAENVYSFLEAITKGVSPISITVLIAIQVVILIPLAFIRDISKLGSAALLADVFIMLGLGYIYYYDISTIAKRGISDTVNLFNSRDFTLTVGSAIFTFEGIGLILPVQSSMKEPQKFERLLLLVMTIITIVFLSVAALSYATFGDKTTVEIINNLPQSSKLVNTVQFLYSIAVLVGDPVQLFPALRITETALFGHRSGKRDPVTKWKKNAFRAAMVVLCGVVSALGASDLDKFVALIGSFACVPLVYIYPAYLHYRGIAESRGEKVWDVLLMGLGFVAMVYTTGVTVARWSEP